MTLNVQPSEKAHFGVMSVLILDGRSDQNQGWCSDNWVQHLTYCSVGKDSPQETIPQPSMMHTPGEYNQLFQQIWRNGSYTISLAFSVPVEIKVECVILMNLNNITIKMIPHPLQNKNLWQLSKCRYNIFNSWQLYF